MIIEKKEKPKIIYEKPKYLTKENIIYWSPEYKELKGEYPNICSKAKKFLQEDRVREFEGYFLVLPISGYNKTTYKVKINPDECNCQFFNKTGKTCSHILAVKMYMRLKKNEID